MCLLIKNIHLASSLVLALTFGTALSTQSLSALEYWEFNDVAGKSFSTSSNPDNMANSGSNNSYWNHGATGGSMETDGNGNFVVSQHAGQTYRSLPENGYSTPYSSGRYRLEMNLTSWSLDATANGASLALDLVDAGNAKVAGMLIGTDNSGNARFQFWGVSASATGSTNNLAYQAHNLASHTSVTPASIAVEFDFDNETLEYFVDGSSIRVIDDFNATEFSELKFFTNNPWTTGSTVSIDSMGLIGVPEPETYALTMGLIVLVVLGIRKRLPYS